MQDISLNPQLGDKFSTLEKLIADALRLYGEMHPSSVDGDAYMMFVLFANDIVDDVNMHPYHTGDGIDYYYHTQEIRPIPDAIMVRGLAYAYAEQQGSQKMPMLFQRYVKTMNKMLYAIKSGGSSFQHELGAFDRADPV
jgi:hypothetical protein